MVRKENVVIKEGLRDGKGIIEIHHFLTEEELMGHGKMYARLVMKPHSSIGWHQHVGHRTLCHHQRRRHIRRQ